MNREHLEVLRRIYRDGLLNDVLPFWIGHGIDYEQGGLFTCLDRDGTIIDTDKSVWAQGRFTWVLSEMYNTVEPRQEWLDLTEHGSGHWCDGCCVALRPCQRLHIVGAKGAVGSTYNVLAPLFVRIMRRFEEGELEEAERLQYLAVRFVKLLERHAPLHTSLKAVLKIIGLDCGGVRLPQQPLAEGAEDAIRRDLEELGLMDWIVTVS